MARQIRLSQMGDYCNQQMEQLLRVAVLETDSRLKQASPVDTGRFRVSWQVGENAAPGGEKPAGTYSGIPRIERIGYQQEKPGNVYSVHNNLPYAEKLANGSSRQAPAGWVQGIAKDIQGFVRVNADRIGRQS
jgi:hypothetical protein